MRIQNIQASVFCAQNSHENNTKHKLSTPVKDGLNTAAVWFGFGVGLDLLSRKVHFAKSPLKNSIAMNGIIGTAAGAITCAQDTFTKNRNLEIPQTQKLK